MIFALFPFLRHKHQWWVAVVQIEHFTSGDQTNVLHRCDCGEVKVEVIDGGWTAAQLGLVTSEARGET